MKKRVAIIATCGGLLTLTATFAHSQQIFDRWGNLRTENPGKNAGKTGSTEMKRGIVTGAGPGGGPRRGKISDNESPRPQDRRH
jgi:hypothetical protein